MNFLWTQPQHYFQNVLIIPPITPWSAIFELTNHKVNHHLINHILFIFKYYVQKTRENGSLDLKVLKKKKHKLFWKTNMPQQTRKTEKVWTKIETIVGKHIRLFLIFFYFILFFFFFNFFLVWESLGVGVVRGVLKIVETWIITIYFEVFSVNHFIFLFFM